MNAARAAADARRRRAQLAAIHAAAAQLGLDDDVYRDLLERVSATCGKPVRSAADLCPKQRAAVLDELRNHGAKAPAGSRTRRAASYPGKPNNFVQLPLMVTKVEALLADMKLSWSYADAIAKRMFGVERVAWCRKEPQLAAIIAALHVEQEKRDLGARVDSLLQVLGWSDDELTRQLVLPQQWRRRRATLKQVADVLHARCEQQSEEAPPCSG